MESTANKPIGVNKIIEQFVARPTGSNPTEAYSSPKKSFKPIQQYYNPQEKNRDNFTRMFSSEVGNKMVNVPNDSDLNVYDSNEDAMGSTIGSDLKDPISTSSRLFNYLTSTPGFLMLTSNNFQFFIDSGVTLYSPTRIYNPGNISDGKICTNELGIIASMQIAEKDKIPTVENFIQYTTVDNGVGGRKDIINPNFLFYVKFPVDKKAVEKAQQMASGRGFKQARVNVSADLKQIAPGMEFLRRVDETPPTTVGQSDVKERNEIINELINKDDWLFDITDYLKNDRFFDILQNLIGFDIYEKSVGAAEKTYKGILKSVTATCPSSGVLGFGSSNLILELTVQIRGADFNIGEDKIKFYIGATNTPSYFADVHGQNNIDEGIDGVKFGSNISSDPKQYETKQKNRGKNTILAKMNLEELKQLSKTRSDVSSDVSKTILREFLEQGEKIKKTDHFLLLSGNPFVYTFDAVESVNTQRTFRNGTNCYEIKNDGIEWLGVFGSIASNGKITFKKKYDKECASYYQYNYVENGPKVVALKPVVGDAVWLNKLNAIPSRPSKSLIDDIYVDELRSFNIITDTLPKFHAIKKIKPEIDSLKTEFNEKISGILKTSDAVALKQTVQNINDLIKQGSAATSSELSINDDLNQKLTSVFSFVKLINDTSRLLKNKLGNFKKYQTEVLGKDDLASLQKEFDMLKNIRQNNPKSETGIVDGKGIELTNVPSNVSSIVTSNVSSNSSLEIPSAMPNDNEIKVGDYVEIIGDISKFCFLISGVKQVRYARVLSINKISNKNVHKKDFPDSMGYSLFFLRNQENVKNPKNLVECTVFDKTLLKKVAKEDISAPFTRFAPVDGGAKHTRRSHTGQRKNVTRHGKHGLIHRRTSHKGRKRLAYSKTAKK